MQSFLIVHCMCSNKTSHNHSHCDGHQPDEGLSSNVLDEFYWTLKNKKSIYFSYCKLFSARKMVKPFPSFSEEGQCHSFDPV